MNSLYGQPIRKDVENEYVVKKESWLPPSNDDKLVKEHEQHPNSFFVVKLAPELGIYCIVGVENVCSLVFEHLLFKLLKE